jgi:hypothetical protein
MSIESGAGVINQNTFLGFRSRDQAATPARPLSGMGTNRVTESFS